MSSSDKPEMVADLMDQDVAYHSPKRFFMLGPVVKNWAAVE
jgi:hypothetical protein